MEGDLGPEEIRSRKFEVVRRGYDRLQVDRFLDEVAVVIAAAKTELSDLRSHFTQAGMPDIPDMKAELDAVSVQIAEVLNSAREAAEGMRSRASEDAVRWRAEADKEARTMRSVATQDAEEARRSAWKGGTEALKSADEESAAILDQARQDSLFIRASAERESLRLTGDARRDGEELIRKARTDAERLLLDARSESDRILDTARQSAQNAQERARALEQRRSELMAELESARLSIGQLEQEIDSRREALQAVAETPDSGVRIIKTETALPAEWYDEDATVKLVSAADVPKDEPVDPDAFVAEVAELQAAPLERNPQSPLDPETELQESESVDISSDGELDVVVESSTASPVDRAVLEETVESFSIDSELLVKESVGRDETSDPYPASDPVEPDVSNGIEDLFAQLRTRETASPDLEFPVESSSGEFATVDEVESGQFDPSSSEITLSEEDEGLAVPATFDSDPFELRDRVLLPIENRTLRSVKRSIVELQNRVLEELRLDDDDWEPDASMFMAAVADDISRLNSESFVGGHAAASELLAAETSSPPDRPASQTAVGDFVGSFMSSVADAVKSARVSGGGKRQMAASVGRVFRAWRTDEAERRLRLAGLVSYSEGLLGAYPGLGVERVVAVAPSVPCGECPADTGRAWIPGASLPPGTGLPPASPNCRATIVPAN